MSHKLHNKANKHNQY